MDKITIFNKLKQQYSPLGLGDEILSAHADNLISTGLVTNENADAIVESQKLFLEQLQRSYDKRAADASRTARDKAVKEFQEEQEKKDAAAKKAAEEQAAKEAAEKEAAKKAAEEEAARKAAKRQEEFQRKIEELTKASTEANERWKKQFDELKKLSDSQNETIQTMTKEREEQKAQEVLRAHREKINAKAKELGIPQFRIDEGFTIADDADDETITNHLAKVASNIKAFQTPTGGGHYQLNEGTEISGEQMKEIAASMVR